MVEEELFLGSEAGDHDTVSLVAEMLNSLPHDRDYGQLGDELLFLIRGRSAEIGLDEVEEFFLLL